MGVDYYTCLVCQETVYEGAIGTLHVYQNKKDYDERNYNYVEVERACFDCIEKYTGEEPVYDEDVCVYVLLIKKENLLNIIHTKMKH
jgi:hypothetical protein